MSEDEQRARRGRLLAMVVAALLVLGGAVAVVIGLTSQEHAPQPSTAAAAGTSTSAPATPSRPSSPAVARGPAPLPAATPTHVDIPAIGASSDLLQLGQNPDGTVQVPPLSANSQAGWYRFSPSPGELGPAVLLGHVDSAEYGPGIFFRLGALHPGDTVTVTRADHRAATFRVDRVESYPKDHFPTLDVYGNTDDAELRLITCGGAFDPSARSYLNNIVVYASLVSSAAA